MYLNEVSRNGKAYNGFNLLTGTVDELWYYSNYGREAQQVTGGLHGLSNHLLDTPWPKVVRGKEKLAAHLLSPEPDVETFFKVLYDEDVAPDNALPNTGLPLEHERALSSMFIKTNGYGSRCTTVIMVDRANNVFAYSVLGHRHEAEVLSSWREWTNDPAAEARMMVHSGPWVRGIYLTLHARFDERPAQLEHGATAFYRAAYEGRPFVRVLERAPELTHAVGTNYALLHAELSDDGRELQVMVAEDNLVKGAGGQAIQAMNLALGFDETAGLTAVGVFPC